MFRKKDTWIHFVGVGGIGMSGIAEVLLNLGYTVSGSDLKEGETTRRLVQLGCKVAYGHQRDNVGDCDVVVISSAVRPSNPEVVEARVRGVPVIPRAEMLAELMRMKVGVAVAGSHGKTTTTSLVSAVMGAAGLDPTVVIGGKVNALGSNARLGQGEYLVAEADESDGSFLKLSPTVAVVTNIDPEHLDHYGDLDHLKRAFIDFVNRVPFYGTAVLCLDHPNVQAILPMVEKRHVTYGLTTQADYRAENVRSSGLTTTFRAFRRELELGEVTVAMPGLHNALNSLAVLAVADYLDVPFETTRAALASFAGVQRRFTVRGEARGVMVVDDYGHHPAEVRATLAAARALGRRVVVAFQPHRYTRTRDLLEDFATAFYQADVVLLTAIYAAGEDPIAGITGERLASEIAQHGHKHVDHVGPRSELVPALLKMVRPGDLVLTLGAGDITRTGDELLAALRA